MTDMSGYRRHPVRTPSPEPARHPIGAFTDNNPFTNRHDFNDVDNQDWNLPVPLLESPLAHQLVDCGVELSTDLRTCDILLHYAALTQARRQIGRAHSKNGVYILDFDILDYSGDSNELISLVPLRFEHIHRSDWKHPDGRPWVPHHPHPCELVLHDLDPDGICRDCHTPTTSTNAIAGRGLAAIVEAERDAQPDEGDVGPRARSTEQLESILQGRHRKTFNDREVARPYTKEFLVVYPHWHDPTKKLTMAKEEELARREAEELCQKSIAEERGTFAWAAWGAEEEESASNEGGWGSAGGWGSSNIDGTWAEAGGG
ncbi:unnamed protein product [Closterium sp. NIES-53]